MLVHIAVIYVRGNIAKQLLLDPIALRLVEWFFTGIEHFRYITIRSLFIKLLYVLTVFIFIRNPEDYKLYFVMTVGVVVFNAIINIFYVKDFVVFGFRDMFSQKYLKQNFSLGIYSIMTSMYLTFNVMYLGLTTDNVQVGYYTTAFNHTTSNHWNTKNRHYRKRLIY